MRLDQTRDDPHKPALLTLELRKEASGPPVGRLRLPASDRQLEQALLEAGIDSIDGAVWDVESGELSGPVAMAVRLEREDLRSLNELCRAIEPLDTAQREKLDAMVLMVRPRSAGAICRLAENLDQFDFISGIHTPEEYGSFMIRESGHFHYDENLDRFYDYRLYGEVHACEDGGKFTDLGYVSYQGALALDELLWEEPAERKPIIGRITYAGGETEEFTDSEAYLQAVREELPFMAATGFRCETLTGDPEVRKAVDDMICDLYGEENPHALEDYQKRPGMGMTMGGI